MAESSQPLREQVAWACRILALEGYADLTLGHVSARPAGGDVVQIKRKGVALDEVDADDVIELDLHSADVGTTPGMHLEAVLHTEVYKLRPDVGAVVHGHPPFATAFAATGATLEMLTHDSVLFSDGVPVFEESPDMITDATQGKAVAQALGDHRAIVLRNHGVLVVGKSVRWAVLTALTLERAVRLQSIARTLGTLRPIAPDRAREMVADKYQDRFVDEYWEAWNRRLERLNAAPAGAVA
jgi:ribulose-5-phosphate 4-epimerase/fuculose-1-phosphate aldolase